MSGEHISDVWFNDLNSCVDRLPKSEVLGLYTVISFGDILAVFLFRTKIVHDPRKDSHLELAHFYLNVCIFPDTHNFDLILKSSLKKVVYLLCCIQIYADLEVLGNDSFCCIQIHADLAVRCRAIDLIHPKEALKCPKETQETYIKLRKSHLICILYHLY